LTGAPRAVHQLLAAFAHGDAVGNEALAIQGLLRRMGYTSDIFAEHVDPRMAALVRPLGEYALVSSEKTVCLFHFAIGSAAGPLIFHAPDSLVIVYHNVTPARFFLGFNNHLTGLCYHGRRQLACYAPRTSLALAASEFSRRELEEAGFERTGVLPIVLDLSVYRRPASPVISRLFRDGKKNVLCVGRVSPNKGLEAVLRAFGILQKQYKGSRLLVVGDDQGVRHYTERLSEMVLALGLRDVVFSGHVDDDELIAYYSVADLLLSLSEHEGFCVPLLEAMLFSVPVIALDRGAVGETLEGAGLLLRGNDPHVVAGLMGEVLMGGELRQAVLGSQARRVSALRAADPGEGLLKSLSPVLSPPSDPPGPTPRGTRP
jgi:glycosyltransferase involved in cell wall biosynthesis